jgi:peptide/nickel transport system substrate-binding protein
VEFTVLGPLAVSHHGRQVSLGSRKQRAVLAILLLRANEVVSPDVLIDELWGEQPPPSAPHTLQVYVSRLRAALRASGAPDGILVTRPSGYMLRVGFHERDLDLFEHLAAEGRRSLEAGSPGRASDRLIEALSVWKGAPLADLAFEPFARIDVERLEERRLAALEDRIEADLALGKHGALVAELKDLVERHPLRERLRGQLMLALYRAGRQADALTTYRDARDHLVGELGLEPSKALQALEQAILRHDESLDPETADREHLSVLTLTSERPDDADGNGSREWGDLDTATEPHAGMRSDDIRETSRRRRALLAAAAVLAVGVTAATVGTREGKHQIPAISQTHANAVVFADAGRATMVAQEDTGGRPAGVSIGAGSVWVSDAANDRLLRLDPQTHRVVDRIPVGHSPSAIVANTQGVWVANTGSRTVSEVNPRSGTVVATVPVGNAPVAVAFAAGAVWVADASDGTLIRIDPAKAAVVATIQLGQPLSDVAAGLGAVWASSASSGLLIRVDPTTDQPVQALTVGNGPSSIAVAGDAVWVANPPDGTLSRIDPATGSVRKINVSQPGDLAASADALWVVRTDHLDVARIDPRIGVIVQTIPIGVPAGALSTYKGGLAVATLATPAAHRGGTLRVVGGDGLDSIDPGEAWSSIGWQLLSLTNDGLLTYARSSGPGGATIVPDLATSLPVARDGGRAFTFQLRSGVRYSTGSPVRPRDFRIALERQYRASTGLAALGVPILGAERCSPRRCDLSAGVSADDASRTITIQLSRPDPAFLYELALPFGSAVPAGSPPIADGPRALAATGPYRIERYIPGHELVLRRNARFRPWSAAAQPAGFPDSIRLTLGLDAVRQKTAVVAGRADIMLDSPPAASLPSLGRRWPLQLHSYVQPEVAAMFLNIRAAPFDRPAVRRALALAVDRTAIVRIAGGSKLARATCQILPPSFPGYRPFCPYTTDPTPAGVWRTPNLALARRLIANSGTPGMAISVSTVADDPTKLATARYFVRLLRRLGYRASLRLYPGIHRYYSAVGLARSRSQIGVFGWTADYEAGSAFFQPLFTCAAYRPTAFNLNAAGVCDPALDREIAEATRLQATNVAAANRAWQRIDREITVRSVWIPLFNPMGVDFVGTRVGNYQRHSAFSVLLDQLWVR